MAQPPLLQLTDIALTFGGDPVFSGLDLVVQPREKVALVGRNGSGKSTLLKVMAGLVEADSGARSLAPGVSVGYMAQEPDLSGCATLRDYATSGLEVDEAYKADMVADGLKIDLDIGTEAASGGEQRRAALTKLLAEAPELMLLDEPTNHLDVNAIAWLEERLKETSSGVILISHDRRFLSNLTDTTLWIDRGAVRRRDQGFDGFEAWRDKVWEEEDQSREKLDKKIKAEAKWAVEGISARRKRNQGRLRNLEAMRADRANQIKRQGTADMALASAPQSGKRVIEATEIEKAFDGRRILAPFSLRVLRGDRIALVGPNGAGKTTLLKMLTGEVAPDAGTVSLGTNVDLAVFDQQRAQLEPEATLWDTLTNDPQMRVRGQSDQVMVRGQPKHVVGYLRDFLFDERQARAPVRSLSGGEKARLLLARIMARESNLLVLDEPTNDLDIETLDLLQDVIGEYDGTVMIVSHDRDFIDRVATATVAMEGDGHAIVYAGGWSDYQAQRAEGAAEPAKAKPKAAKAKKGGKDKAARPAQAGLTVTERHRLDALPGEMLRLEAEIGKLQELLDDPQLYETAPVKFQKATDALEHRQTALAKAEDEWLNLAEKAET